MAGNAGALTGNTMKDYVYGTDGTVEILHIRTPHAATKPHRDKMVRDKGLPWPIFSFGGLDKMRDMIIRMFHNKEIPIVNLFDWLLPPQVV